MRANKLSITDTCWGCVGGAERDGVEGAADVTSRCFRRLALLVCPGVGWGCDFVCSIKSVSGLNSLNQETRGEAHPRTR